VLLPSVAAVLMGETDVASFATVVCTVGAANRLPLGWSADADVTDESTSAATVAMRRAKRFIPSPIRDRDRSRAYPGRIYSETGTSMDDDRYATANGLGLREEGEAATIAAASPLSCFRLATARSNRLPAKTGFMRKVCLLETTEWRSASNRDREM
jgi:hypothetical protein